MLNVVNRRLALRGVRRGVRQSLPFSRHSLRTVWHTLFLLALVVPVVLWSSTIAQGSIAPSVHAAPLPSSSGAIVAAGAEQVTILVLDMSGSMGTNDPNGLRCSAANAYISLSGVGDYIGVVGLDNSNGVRGGAHGFETAQVWAPPTDMATLPARTNLINTIATKSNHCRPDQNTPTYDALAQALTLLERATSGTSRTGSVILLTDGEPAPDNDAQIRAIQQDLTPQFQQHNFSVDTIALGSNGASQSAHPFLSALSNATSGKFYDDGKGVIQGSADALNIAPFFVDIFARRNHRTLGSTVDPTTVSGATSRDLVVTEYVSHLDVIVVKDNPSTNVSLTSPSGQTFPPLVAGTFIATDPHYAIFSIDGRQAGVDQGTWQVNVTGSGRFLVDSLIVSNVQLAITEPTPQAHALPLGKDFTIAATATANGSTIVGAQFTISGTITYQGEPPNGGAPFSQNLQLSDKGSPGVYQVTVNVPESQLEGAYEITINVTHGSGAVLGSDKRSIRMELFPTPYFLSGHPAAPTADTVSADAVRWDPVLQTLYSLPVVSWVSGWPLRGLPARPTADIAGQVMLHDQAYADARVTGTAQKCADTAAQCGSSTPTSGPKTPVTVMNDGQGRFHVNFPAPSTGDYQVLFQTSGKLGDSAPSTRTVHLRILPATPLQEAVAWGFTLAYLLLLVFVILLLRRPFLAHPAGQWTRQAQDPADIENNVEGNFRQSRARGFWMWLLHPNWRTSREALADRPGVIFIFRQGGVIQVRAGRHGGNAWVADQRKLSTTPVAATTLANEANIYTITPDAQTPRATRQHPGDTDSWGSGSSGGWGDGGSGESRRRPGLGGLFRRRSRDGGSGDSGWTDRGGGDSGWSNGGGWS